MDMKPVEFVLWLNGAAELVGDQPPTPEQWATMRERLGEAVGGLVAARLLERAEEAVRADERRKKEEGERVKAVEQMLAQRAARPSPGLVGYQAQVGTYVAQADLAAQRMRNLANAPSLGIISEVPETAEPRSPGFINRILGKVTT